MQPKTPRFHMKKSLYLLFWAAVAVALGACASPGCEEVSLQGEDARNAIAKHEQMAPNTFFTIPDNALSTSTRDVEALLNELQAKGLLTYAMQDSSRQMRTLPGKEPGAVADTATFYDYTLQWNPSVDAYSIKTDSVEQVVSYSLLGREYPGELRYRSRFLEAGEISVSDSDSLYYRRNCSEVAYKYTYSVGSLNELAAMAGLLPVAKTVRAVNIPLSQ
jgi:hypothetical protein